jgi:hypothetical protein
MTYSTTARGVTMEYKRKRNPMAKDVRSAKYKQRVIPDKHKDRKEEEKWKEMINYLKSQS